MNCTEAKRYLDLFLDGELDVEQNLKVLEHLNLCACCSAVFDGERWVAGEMKACLCGERAPAGLRERIGAALDRECASRHRRRWVALGAVAAAAAAVAAAALIVPRRGGDAPPVNATQLAVLAAAEHDRERAEVAGDGICVCRSCAERPKESLEAWFAKRGQHTCTHPLEEKGLFWKSGAIWRDGVRGQILCWTVQVTKDRESLSHTALPAAFVRWDGGQEIEVHGRSLRRFDVGGRVVVMGEDHGFV